MEIKILRTAQQDLVDGYHFYEQQRQGIGQYFLDNLYADIESLATTAGIHPIIFKQYHRLLAKKFPFAIYYKTSNQTVYIYAILDCRRNPTWIRKKLT